MKRFEQVLMKSAEPEGVSLLWRHLQLRSPCDPAHGSAHLDDDHRPLWEDASNEEQARSWLDMHAQNGDIVVTSSNVSCLNSHRDYVLAHDRSTCIVSKSIRLEKWHLRAGSSALADAAKMCFWERHLRPGGTEARVWKEPQSAVFVCCPLRGS